MDSVARISFFIVLSFALHIASLPFDSMWSVESFESRQVGVNYVSRSLDSFYAAPEPRISTSHVVKNTIQHVQKITKTDSEQSRRHRMIKKPSAAIRPVIPITGVKQKKLLPKTAAIVVAGLTSEKSADELEPTKPDAVDVEIVVAQLPVKKITGHEVIDPLRMQTAVNVKSLPEKDLSAQQGIAVQTKNRVITQNQVSSSSGQRNNSHGQGFKNALPCYDVNPPPRYPEVAKLRGWEGKVVFKALILKSGQVDQLKVLASSGYRSLDNAARKAINRWKFKPATSFGISIDSRVEIPVTFSLKDL